MHGVYDKRELFRPLCKPSPVAHGSPCFQREQTKLTTAWVSTAGHLPLMRMQEGLQGQRRRRERSRRLCWEWV